ncbi:hypothetical protein DEH69_09440 [Streptomyces sp. PT12]|nr:hypothetical protein DEH69_09440 [Streptomyces sp. PT12]
MTVCDESGMAFNVDLYAPRDRTTARLMAIDLMLRTLPIRVGGRRLLRLHHHSPSLSTSLDHRQ